MSKKLPLDFYRHSDVVYLAKELIGKYLCTSIDGQKTSGMIVETEAYRGFNDAACHARDGRKTQRNSVMFENGGLSYVYLCYGIHPLFNIVTNKKNCADAVLIRAIHPLSGLPLMQQRRKLSSSRKIHELTSGPGKVSKALGIHLDHYGLSLTGSTIWLEEHQNSSIKRNIQSSPRIGIGYAGKDASLPWRFFLKNDPFVSKVKI